MISSLTYFTLNRKGKLITFLNNHTDELPLEKQHQLYGAITELNRITDILHNQKTKEIAHEKNPDEIFLFRPMQKKGLVNDIITFIKDFF